jgi:hypothetical protein
MTAQQRATGLDRFVSSAAGSVRATALHSWGRGEGAHRAGVAGGTPFGRALAQRVRAALTRLVAPLDDVLRIVAPGQRPKRHR